MNYKLILFVIVSAVLVSISPVFAYEITYDFNGTKLLKNPTVCGFELEDDKMNENQNERIMKELKNSIDEWEKKLQSEDIKNKEIWEINYVEITSKNERTDEDCDVKIIFEPKPSNEWEYFTVLGVAEPEINTEKTIITIYYLDVGLSYETEREGDTIWYWYEPYYTEDARTTNQIGAVIKHEFGHALGLGHYEADDPDVNTKWAEGFSPSPSIMAPIAHQNSREMKIMPIDIDRVISLYGNDGFHGAENELELFSENKVKILLFDDNYEGIQEYTDSILQKTKDENALYYKGYAFFQTEQYEEALRYLNEGTSINPINEDSWYYQARSSYNLKDYDSALNSINKALEINPESLRDIQRKGLILFMLGEYEKSITEYNKALKIDAENKDTLIRKANSLYELKRYDNSLTYYELVLKEEPKDIDALLGKAKTLHKNLELKESLKFYDLVLEEDSSHLESLKGKHEVHIELKEEKKAKLVLEKIKLLDTDNMSDDSTHTLIESPPIIDTTKEIPSWIKSNAGWWAEGVIDDSSFVQGIQFLITENMLQIPDSSTYPASDITTKEIPSWIKSNAGWWSNGLISDEDFLKGIQYLVKNGIISVN